MKDIVQIGKTGKSVASGSVSVWPRVLLLFVFSLVLGVANGQTVVDVDDDDEEVEQTEVKADQTEVKADQTEKKADQTEEEADESEAEVDEEDEIVVTDQDGNEELIDFPEAMTYALDSLMNLYMSKTYLSEDDDCHTADENPTYDSLVYINRLSRLPNVIGMAYNDVVQRFIDRYSGQLRHSVSYMLGACNFYMPVFEEALEAYGLPLELKYLPVVESALNPNAVSRVGAAGLWQFMLTTGKQYGLEVNSLVDERRDPVKASYAAAHYLSDLYQLFGDWNLVLASYNCGPANINKAIHRAGGVKDYWQIYPYLPKETRGYVPAFIAANYIMTYYSAHNICPLRTTLPQRTDTVIVSRDVYLPHLAEVLDLDIDMLHAMNPQYRRDVVPGLTTPSAITLDMGDVSRFIDNQDSIYSYVPPTRRVTIRRGETLSDVAKRTGTTVAKLRKLNGIRGNRIRAGRRLRVR